MFSRLRSINFFMPFLLAITAGLFTIMLTGPVFGENRLAVTLRYFRGEGLDQEVLLEWATGTEFNTAGFRLERALTRTGTYLPLDQIGFVPAAGDPIGGADYSYIDDDNVINGNTYWYRLVEIEFNNNENYSDPISIVAGIVEVSPTTAVSQPTSQGSPPGVTPASTTTVESTQTRSQISSPTPTSTPTVVVTIVPASGTAPIRSNSVLDSESSTLDNEDGEGSAGQAISQAPAPLQVTGYPEPPSETPNTPLLDDTNNPEAYPGIATPVFLGEATPYPATEGTGQTTGTQQEIPSQEKIGVVGSQPVNESPASAQQRTDDGLASTVILWLGFLAALVVFLAGVYASILLYTRRGNEK